MPTFGRNIETLGASTGTTTGTTVTANAAANTKGNYAQLSAATAYPACGVIIDIPPGNAACDYLLDIAVGAAASESVIISDILVSSTHGGTAQCFSVEFPCAIPAGTRVSARCQASTGGTTLIIVVHLITLSTLNPVPLMKTVTTYGDNTVDSGGTSVDPGGSANTLGAYSQVVASTTYPMRGMVLAFGNQVNTAPASARWLVNVAVGAGGAEVVKIDNIQLRAGTSTTQGGASPIYTPPIACDIPAGTRLAVNAQCTITDATDRLIDVVIYGLI